MKEVHDLLAEAKFSSNQVVTERKQLDEQLNVQLQELLSTVKSIESQIAENSSRLEFRDRRIGLKCLIR